MGIYQYFCKGIARLHAIVATPKIIDSRSELFRLQLTNLHRQTWGDSWYRAGVIITDGKDNFLLVEELRTRRNGVWFDSQDMWNIASGSCLTDEKFLDAAVREAREELGRGVVLKGICAIKHGKHHDDPCLLIVFLAELTDETFEFNHQEIKSQRWFSGADILKLERQGKLRSPDLVLQAVGNYHKGLILPLGILNEYQI